MIHFDIEESQYPVVYFFSRIFYNRLDKYLKSNNDIRLEQIGFRRKFRRGGHLFTLKALTDKIL